MLQEGQGSAWPALQLALLRALYYLGFLALPAVLLWAGLSPHNVLSTAYLAGLVIWFLAHSLALEPHVQMGVLGKQQVIKSIISFQEFSVCFSHFFDALLHTFPNRA